ncbi:MAG: alkaline phosphatase family protein [Anaerolineae bacterium]|nr:alkaline phosphatase family protein [Anaerolineae bacterium]
MKKYISVLLSIFILVGLVVGSWAWITEFYDSAYSYHPPFVHTTQAAETSVLPRTSKVVIVLLSGLGDEAFQTFDLPVLDQLAQTGASSTIQSLPPTFSQTSRMTLITGASPDLNGVAPIDKPFEALDIAQVDSIFAEAHTAHLKTALLGLDDWRGLIPREYLDETFLVNVPGFEADQAILNVALPLLKDDAMDLVLIQFTSLDFVAAQLGGTSGDAYLNTATRLDSYIGQISRIMNLDRSTLLILSDHGHVSSGGYGGTELEVIQQPLVINGRGINPGQYSLISQTDIAPTVSTLLGLPAPSTAQGRILFEMLNLNQEDKTLAQIALAEQRIRLAQDYLTNIVDPEATLPESLQTDLERAAITFSQNNINGAFQLALLTQETADSQIVAARHSRIQSERWPRLFFGAVGALIWFFVMWRRRNNHAGLILIATIVTVVLYHVLFQLQGHSYSISAFSNILEIPFDITRRMVVSFLAGGALVLIFLMLVDERDWVTLLNTGYGFSLFTIFVLAMPLLWAFWQNGFTIRWYIPSVDVVFWQVISLLEILAAAVIGLILPWPIMLLNVFVNIVRSQLSDSKPESGRDPIPGLR